MNTTEINCLSSSQKTGIGSAIISTHHGELLQGVFNVDGIYEKGLLTCPCNIFTASARFKTSNGKGVNVYPNNKAKSKNAAEKTMSFLGLQNSGGYLWVNSQVPQKRGLGSSTLDVMSSIIATSKAFGYTLSAGDIAHIAIESETASDPLSFDLNEQAFLFAQRKGFIIEDFKSGLPKMKVLGFCTDNDGVETLNMPLINYSTDELEWFENLRTLTRYAIQSNNASLLGEVASQSAIINQKYLPKPYFNEIKYIAKQTHAEGIQISHSGSVVGILWDIRKPISKYVKNAGDLLAELGIRFSYEFTF